MLKSINLIVVLVLVFDSFAYGGDNHLAEYSSKAKTMIKNGEKYHQNVAVIRKMHPVFMHHKRDTTLRQGVRSEENSLKSCVNCHADSTGDQRINDKGQFCTECHKKVGTTIDCFSCHRAIPNEGQIL